MEIIDYKGAKILSVEPPDAAQAAVAFQTNARLLGDLNESLGSFTSSSTLDEVLTQGNTTTQSATFGSVIVSNGASFAGGNVSIDTNWNMIVGHNLTVNNNFTAYGVTSLDGGSILSNGSGTFTVAALSTPILSFPSGATMQTDDNIGVYIVDANGFGIEIDMLNGGLITAGGNTLDSGNGDATIVGTLTLSGEGQFYQNINFYQAVTFQGGSLDMNGNDIENGGTITASFFVGSGSSLTGITASQVGADASGAATTAVSGHAALTTTHGVSGSIVGTANSQTLTHKNLTDATNTFPTFNQNTTGTAANITASSNSSITTLSALSLPSSQVTGLGSAASQNTTAFAPATSGTSILKGNGSGGFSNAAAGTDYVSPTGSGASLTGITASQVSGLSAIYAPLASPVFTGTVTTSELQGTSNTGSNVAGSNIIVAGGQGTGTGLGGSIIFQVAPVGTTGSSVNALVNALTIASTKAATFTGSVTTTQLITGSITNAGPLNFSGSLIGLNSSPLYFDNYSYLSTNGIGVITFITSSSATTGTFVAWKITPTYNQTSGGASNTDFLINRTQTAIGSGTQRLIDAQVGGATKFNVDNTGAITAVGALTVSGVALLSNGNYSGTAPLVQVGDNGYGFSSHNSSLYYWASVSHSFNSSVSAPQVSCTLQTLTYASSIAWAVTSGANATVTLTGNATLASPTGMVAGTTYLLIVKQDSTGSRTLAYTSVKWPGGTAPTLTTTGSGIDILSFFYDGTNLYGIAQKAFA